MARRIQWQTTQTLEGHKGPVNCVAFSRGQGRHLISGGQDRTIRLYNHAKGVQVQEYAGHGYEVLCLQA
jgi:mitogen-activated protein kinase organizer 1